MTRLGWAISILAGLMLLMSAVFKFIKAPPAVDGMEKLGWDAGKLITLGILEAGCTLIYLFPRTAVLGAILLAAYLGGAVATHVRVSDFFISPLIGGILVWLGLWLRDPRIRALVPFRQG
jgi:hypothetical protein